MPIYLVPATFSDKTTYVSIAESTHSGNEDQVVVTSMGEVRILRDRPLSAELTTMQLLPLSFGPEDLERPRQ